MIYTAADARNGHTQSAGTFRHGYVLISYIWAFFYFCHWFKMLVIKFIFDLNTLDRTIPR